MTRPTATRPHSSILVHGRVFIVEGVKVQTSFKSLRKSQKKQRVYRIISIMNNHSYKKSCWHSCSFCPFTSPLFHKFDHVVALAHSGATHILHIQRYQPPNTKPVPGNYPVSRMRAVSLRALG